MKNKVNYISEQDFQDKIKQLFHDRYRLTSLLSGHRSFPFL